MNHKITALAEKLLQIQDSAYWDNYFNIRTQNTRILKTTRSQFNDAVESQPLSYFYIEKLMQHLISRPDWEIVEVGCADGRTALSLASQSFRHIYAVDCEPVLMKRFEKNAKDLKYQNSPVTGICCDILDFDFKNGNAFILYWPFGGKTFQSFLEKLKSGWEQRPREIQIIVWGGIKNHLLKHQDWLSPLPEISQAWVFTSASPPYSKNQKVRSEPY